MVSLILILFVALMLPGLIARTRARLSGRKGVRFYQHLYNVGVLLRKDPIYGASAGLVTRWAPVVYLGATLTAALLLPVGGFGALLSFDGDIVLFCYLLGYYLFRYPLGRRGLYLIAAAGLLGWGCTFAGTMWLSERAGAWNELLLSFYAPNVVLTSAAIFAWVQRVFGRWALPDRIRRLLAGAASTTGGIYGVHMLILWLLEDRALPLLAEAAVVYLFSAALIWAVQQLCRLGRRAAPSRKE